MKTLPHVLMILCALTTLSVSATQVANYHADGNANDFAGTNNATVGSDVTYVAGRLGQGFNFPGTSTTLSNNAVTLPNSTDFTPSNLTFSLWVKFNALTSTISGDTAANVQYLLVKQNGRTYEQGYAIAYTLAKLPDNRLSFALDFGQNDEVVVNSTTRVIVGRWYHVVASYDHHDLKIYVNGRQEGATTETRDLLTASTPVYLGRTNALFHDGLFNGVMDEVQFFNTALTPSQIPALDPANGGLGLVSWWRGEANGKDAQGPNEGGAFGAGKVGRAFSFDGTSRGTVTVPQSASLEPANVSVDAWVKLKTTGTKVNIVSKLRGGSGPSPSYGLEIEPDGTANFFVFTSSSNSNVSDRQSNTVLIPGVWYHIAGTWDGTTARIYVNGTQETGNTQSSTGSGAIDYTGAVELSIGARAGGSPMNGIDGYADEIDVFNRVLTANEIQGIYTAGSAGKNGAPFGSSLVGWWRGEDNATDAQGNNSGTLVTPEAFDASGKVGQAFVASPATSNYLSIPDSPSLHVKTFTIDAWVNFAALPAVAGHIFGKALGGADANSYVVWYQNGALHGYMEGGPVLDYSWSPTLGQWYHVAYTYDGSTQKLYLDGSVVANGNTTVTPSYDTHPALIGGDFSGGNITYFFDGKIDEVDLFDRALSDSEVNAIYTAGTAGKSTGPALSIVDASCLLDSNGAGSMVFTVNVARPNATAITVDYQTMDGSAVAPTDYSPVFNDTLTIPANTSSATITVPVSSSQTMPGMNFFVTLSNPSNATLNRAYGTGSLLTGNAVADFSRDNNASTQLWQYGYTAANGMGFTNYPTPFVGVPNNGIMIGWNGHQDSGVVFNPTTVTQLYNGNGTNGSMQPTDELGLFPSPDGSKTVLRWTAPASGAYQVSGLFEGIEQLGGETTSDVSIVKNGDTANPLHGDGTTYTASGSGSPTAGVKINYLNGYAAKDPFSMTVNVNAGDTLDFRVGWGSNNQYSYDGTGLKVTIAPVVPVTITFSATGPASAGAPIQFDATTATGWNVRVQAATTASPVEGDWTDLNDGNGGAMTEISSGNYRLTTAAYPSGATVQFRAIAAKTGHTDVISVPLGPLNLHQAVLSIGAKLTSTSDFANGYTAYIDDYLIYKLTFTNSGDALAKSLKITATVPDFQYADIPLLVKTTAGSTTVTLASGDTSQLQVGGTFVTGPGLGGSVVGNPNGTTVYIPLTATITSIAHDTNSSDTTHFTISQPATTSSGTKTVSVLVQYGAMRKQFKASDISLSPGGTYLPETSPGAGNAKLVWNVGDLQGTVPVVAPFGYSNYVNFNVKLTSKVAVDQSIGIGNDYKVESTSTPKQPIAGRTGFESGAPNVGCRINGSISFLLNPLATTVAPGGLMTYVFALTNRGTAAATSPVAVVEVPDNVRFADTYLGGTKGVVGVGTTPTYKLAYRVGSPLPQLVLKFPSLAAKTTVQVKVTFQTKWANPTDVPKISTINYGASFLNPAGLTQFTTSFNAAAANNTVDTPGTTDFFAFISDPANKLARSLNQSGVVKVNLAGSLENAPDLHVWKQLSNPISKSEDGGDGVRIDLVQPGEKMVFLIVAQNTGESPTDEVVITEAMPTSCSFVANSAVLIGKTTSTTKSKIKAVQDPDGHHLRFTGLHLEPHDTVSFTYTVLVSSSLVVPTPPAAPLLLTVGDFSIGSGSTTATPEGFATARVIKVLGTVILAQPRLDRMISVASVTHNATATKTELDTLYAKTPSAVPLRNAKVLDSYIPGVQRLYLHYENIGSTASTGFKLSVPLPSGSLFYRASWMTLAANPNPGGLPMMPGTVAAAPAGGSIVKPAVLASSGNVEFKLNTLAAKAKGDVMVEIIIPDTALSTSGSHIGDSSQVISATDSLTPPPAPPRGGSAPPSPPGPPNTPIANLILSGIIVIDPKDLPSDPPPQVPSFGFSRMWSKQFVKPGDEVTVTLVFANDGDVDNVANVNFTVPQNTRFISADAGQGMTDDLGGGDGTGGPGDVIGCRLASNNGPITSGLDMKAHTAGAVTIRLLVTGNAGDVITDTNTRANCLYHDPIKLTPASIQIVTGNELPKLSTDPHIQVLGCSYSTLTNNAILIDLKGGNVVAAGAGNIIAAGAGNLLTSDGAGVVAAGAGNVVAAGAGNLIAVQNPSSLAFTSVGGLLANNSYAITHDKLGNFVVQNTNAIIAAGAGNIIAAGAGNVVAAGAGNVVAAGAGNVVAAGAGNIISAGAGNVVAQGAGNVVAAGAGNIIAAGAGNIIAAGAGNIIAAGAGNVISAGAGNIISAGAGNVVAAGAGN